MNEKILRELYSEESTGNRGLCPRCEAKLVISYDDCECIYCGYVDYSYQPPVARKSKKSIVNMARLWVVRYRGKSGTLAKTVSYVKVERDGYSIAYRVNCPYCRASMSKSSRRSSKQIEKREERHRCDNGHIVTLIWNKTGELGWK